jgi:deazaflavin-dependent oxidoreductase (nitroreductase family)
MAILETVRTKRWYRPLARAPMLGFRLGLAPLVGRRFMLLVTRGRKSRTPRATMVTYVRGGGTLYAAAAYGPRSHWYRNLAADPRATVRTFEGVRSMAARLLSEDAELIAALAVLRRHPAVWRSLRAARDLPDSDEEVLARRRDLLLVQFTESDEPPMPAPGPDLIWVWPLVLLLALLGRRARR